MRNRALTTLFVVSAMLLFLSPNKASATFYLSPNAGGYIPVDGDDASYSLGVTAGYIWNPVITTQLSYSRLFGTDTAPDGDIITGEGIFSLPMKIITPYASTGLGYIHTDRPIIGDEHDAMWLIGGGVIFPRLWMFSLGLAFHTLLYSKVKISSNHSSHSDFRSNHSQEKLSLLDNWT